MNHVEGEFEVNFFNNWREFYYNTVDRVIANADTVSYFPIEECKTL